MTVIAILILISLTIALVFLAAFIWAVKSGQFEDTFTPSLRVLTEDDVNHSPTTSLDQDKNLTPP